MEIWDRKQDHAKRIIESWYLGYMRILEKVLIKVCAKYPENPNSKALLNFVSGRLSLKVDIKSNVLKWIYETQDGFCSLVLDTSFMKNENIKDLTGFVENNFHLVVKCDDNGVEKNMALMADGTSEHLHPAIKALLQSNEKGGEVVDIDVAMASSSPDSQRFLSALDANYNIILYGPPGTGKTHIGCGIIRELGGYILTSLELCITYDSCRDFKATETRIQFLKRLCQNKVLVIDEVGKGIESIEKQILPYIINEFYGSGHLLVFLGNGSNDDFNKIVGEASADRMSESGVYMSLIGDSIRKRK
jgi:hypothetical protein